jgi:serine protease Do
MYRLGLPCLLSTLVLARPAAAQEKGLPSARALQDVMQKAIEQAEPAIACVLVSRSDAYQRFSQTSGPEGSGQLGGFDLQLFERHPLISGLGEKERTRLRRQLDLADRRHVPESFGSGVVVAPGFVLTNYHVVQGAVKVFVRLPGHRGSYADIHAADPRTDLAVLRLLNPAAAPKALPLGEGEKAKRGQFVLTLANPFAAGFRDGKPSASWGIVSNLRHRAPGPAREEERARTLHHYGTLIQTDARLNLGCSGGALIDLDGRLLGLTTATAAIAGGETPGGFAVPFDEGMRRVLAVLLRGEEVEHGYLGVGVDEGADRTEGVVLEQVTPGSPAALAGLKARHVILAVNGTPVRESDELFLALGTQLAGAKVQLEVRKPGAVAAEKVEVELAKFLVPGKRIAAGPGSRPFFRGLRVDHTSLLAQQPPTPLPRIPAGVLVSEVQPHTPAAAANLRPGDVITHVAGRPVTTPAAFYRATRGRAGRLVLTLLPGDPEQPAPKVTLD